MAMAINFTLPTTQEEIPGAIKEINQQIRAAEAQLEGLRGLRMAITKVCSHPKTHKNYDYSEWYQDVYCDVCGKRVM